MGATASICVIREILPGGDTGEMFRWTSDMSPAAGETGGARAAWVQPMSFGLQMRQIRTDFPGTKKPSRQVLGSSRKPFTLRGKFDDRYNYVGFAVAEMRRLEQLVERGNMVEIAHGRQAFIALITEANFDYRRDWDIGYALEVDPDKRKDDSRQDNASPFTVEKPTQSIDDLTLMANSMAELHAKRPPGLLSSTFTTVNDALAKVDDDILAMQKMVAGATGRGSVIGQFQQMAIRAQNIQGSCAEVANSLITARSNLQTGIKTAKTVLQFDGWCKTMGFLSRLAMGRANRAHRGLAERQTPATKRMYRPRKGQSIFEVSRECYGTPFGHRQIARANHFHGLVFDGTEVLVIPED